MILSEQFLPRNWPLGIPLTRGLGCQLFHCNRPLVAVFLWYILVWSIPFPSLLISTSRKVKATPLISDVNFSPMGLLFKPDTNYANDSCLPEKRQIRHRYNVSIRGYDCLLSLVPLKIPGSPLTREQICISWCTCTAHGCAPELVVIATAEEKQTVSQHIDKET